MSDLNGHGRHPYQPPTTVSALELAVWRTVAYVDVFDYPLTEAEIHRYLEGIAASATDVAAVLRQNALFPHHLARSGGYYMLPGREHIVAIRQERQQIAASLWPAALTYGRLIAHLPFIRLVAVTGSLAMDNVETDADIDYLIVTRNGRVWLARAFVIAIVRLAERQGYHLCPNYILAERALQFPDHNLYTAHELAQMIPLSSPDLYQHIRRLNRWTDAILPNAAGPPRQVSGGHTLRYPLRHLAELPLRTPLGHWLDQWEMRRKIRKFQHQGHGREAAFSVDWCKGHFDAHKQSTLTAYQSRLNQNR